MRLNVHEWGDSSAAPLVCLHGVSAHGRRFRRLAEETLAPHFHVVAPDLRGHARSAWDPPWNLETYVEDVLETFDGLGAAAWLGHSFGGRLILELAAREPERIPCAVLLDPAIQILPHVGFDFAQEAARDHSFASIEEAVEARLASGAPTPRSFLEEEAAEHLAPSPDGRLRWQCSRAAVATVYGELCREPPAPAVLTGVPTLVVHASQFGLVREEQLQEYEDALGSGVEIVAVPGGHMVYWDAYDETAAAVEQFLNRHVSVSHA